MLMLSPAMTMGSYEVYADDNDNSGQSDNGDTGNGNEDGGENGNDSGDEGEDDDNEASNENGDDDDSDSNNEGNDNEVSNENNDGNEDNENSDENNNGNEEEDSDENREGNEDGTEAGEDNDSDENEPRFVTPVLPEITEATCDSDPKLVSNDSPAQDGVLYDFSGDSELDNLKAGDTITIIAAPYDRYEGEGIVLDIPDGWTEVENGFAIYEHTFAEPDCEDTEGTDENGDGSENNDTGDTYVAAGEIVTIDREGCIVSITTQLEPGEYELQVWDDQVNIDTVTKSVSEDGEYVFTWEIKNPAMEGAPGVAFVLYEKGEEDVSVYFDYVDPYEYPREVANKCGGVTEDEDQPEGLGGPADPNDPEIFGEGGPADETNMGKSGPEVLTEEVTVKSEPEVVEVTQEGERLPNTATPLYNIMLYGAGILLLGGVCLFVFRRKKV